MSFSSFLFVATKHQLHLFGAPLRVAPGSADGGGDQNKSLLPA